MPTERKVKLENLAELLNIEGVLGHTDAAPNADVKDPFDLSEVHSQQ